MPPISLIPVIVLVHLLISVDSYFLIWLTSICPYFASCCCCCLLFQAPFFSIFITCVPLAPFSIHSTPAIPVSHPIFALFHCFYLPSLHPFFPYSLFYFSTVLLAPVSILSTHPPDSRMGKAKATRKKNPQNQTGMIH